MKAYDACLDQKPTDDLDREALRHARDAMAKLIVGR